MSPTPDWNTLGEHNRGLIWKIRERKMLEEKARRERREMIRLFIASVICLLIGGLLYRYS